MAAITTPKCEYGTQAFPFVLKDVHGNDWSLDTCKGPEGLLVIFMCNHCPFVKAILPKLLIEIKSIQSLGIGVVAINSNDWETYEEDSPEHMRTLADSQHFTFPYLIDETQEVAKKYGAVCTPDFFGFNKHLELQYRGRFDDTKMGHVKPDAKRELLDAMKLIADTGIGPIQQNSSIGCSIKWRDPQ